MRQLLGLISEHGTPTSIDIAAVSSPHRLTIEAALLSPGAAAGEPASWFFSAHAIASQAKIGVMISPVPGGARITCQLPRTPSI